MYAVGKITVGLAATLAMVSFPFWFAAMNKTDGRPPELELPRDHANCIESTEVMRRSHKRLLRGWRDRVVRDGVREYQASDGRKFEMSLTRTCLGCHTSQQDFCGRCHQYVGVSPDCWDCHLEPEK